MHKKNFLIFLLLLLCISSWAQQSNILNWASPKLQKFLTNHPAASKLLTNTLYEAFSNRTLQVYYFYSDDESVARAAHYYLSESVVFITIRENQEPSDEFICLIFEALNSESEKSFRELVQKAKSGVISRSDFAREMLKVEFKAMKSTRDLLANLKFSKKEITESHYYKHFIECPNEFEDFLSYTEKINNSLSGLRRDPIKEYEESYDSLQKK